MEILKYFKQGKEARTPQCDEVSLPHGSLNQELLSLDSHNHQGKNGKCATPKLKVIENISAAEENCTFNVFGADIKKCSRKRKSTDDPNDISSGIYVIIKKHKTVSNKVLVVSPKENTFHKSMHDKKTLRCKECSYATTSRKRLMVHYSETHTGETPCNGSESLYSLERSSPPVRHLENLPRQNPPKEYHPGENPIRQNPPKEYHPRENPIRQNPPKEYLPKENPLRENFPRQNLPIEGIFRCTECHYITTQKHILARHIRTHTGERPYKCPKCGWSTTSQQILTAHLRTHTGEKPYVCTDCPYSTADKALLTKHLRYHTETNPYKCSQCSFSGPAKRFVTRHLKSQHGGKKFECKECSYSASEKRFLIMHSKTHFVEIPYKCTQCSYTSPYKAAFTKHINTHTREKPFECPKCPYRTTQRRFLVFHLKTHTDEEVARSERFTHQKAPPFGRTIHKCPMCWYSSSSTKAVSQHIRTHTGEKPFKCTMCPFRSSRNDSIVKHISRIHTRVKKPYKCLECSYSSTNIPSVTKHLKTHSRETFLCSQCPFITRTKILLAKHARIHSGKGLYSCIECSYKANVKSSLTEHLRTHTGEKPYKCPECPFATAARISLRRHSKNHTQQNFYKCTKCSYSATHKSSLTRHLKDYCDKVIVENGLLENHNLVDKERIHTGTIECDVIIKQEEEPDTLESDIMNKKKHDTIVDDVIIKPDETDSIQSNINKKTFDTIECDIIIKEERNDPAENYTVNSENTDIEQHDGTTVTSGKPLIETSPPLKQVPVVPMHKTKREAKFKCTKCPFKSLHRIALFKHFRTHTEINKFARGEGSSATPPNQSSVVYHVKTHSEEKCDFLMRRLKTYVKNHTL